MAKTVFITGASSGIGASLAEQYAQRGDNVVLMARRLDRLTSLCEKLKPGATLAVQGDVRSKEDVTSALAAAEQKFGAIDIVIANAGFAMTGRFDKLTVEDYRRQFETNVFGVMHTIYEALPYLKKSKGRLAVMGSVCGHLSAPTASPYSMSKFAVRALCEALWIEWGSSGVGVTLISPGFVESEIRHIDKQGNVNAEIKDPVPAWLVMPTEKAARQMIKAIDRRCAEAVITNHGKLFVFLSRHLPWLLPRAARLLGQ